MIKAFNVNQIMPGDDGALTDTARIVAAATIGGTISKATGGKFANGAVTAAFTADAGLAKNGNFGAKISLAGRAAGGFGSLLGWFGLGEQVRTGDFGYSFKCTCSATPMCKVDRYSISDGSVK